MGLGLFTDRVLTTQPRFVVSTLVSRVARSSTGGQATSTPLCMDKIARSYYNIARLQIIQGVVVCDTMKLNNESCATVLYLGS